MGERNNQLRRQAKVCERELADGNMVPGTKEPPYVLIETLQNGASNHHVKTSSQKQVWPKKIVMIPTEIKLT